MVGLGGAKFRWTGISSRVSSNSNTPSYIMVQKLGFEWIILFTLYLFVPSALCLKSIIQAYLVKFSFEQTSLKLICVTAEYMSIYGYNLRVPTSPQVPVKEKCLMK